MPPPARRRRSATGAMTATVTLRRRAGRPRSGGGAADGDSANAVPAGDLAGSGRGLPRRPVDPDPARRPRCARPTSSAPAPGARAVLSLGAVDRDRAQGERRDPPRPAVEERGQRRPAARQGLRARAARRRPPDRHRQRHAHVERRPDALHRQGRRERARVGRRDRGLGALRRRAAKRCWCARAPRPAPSAAASPATRSASPRRSC